MRTLCLILFLSGPVAAQTMTASGSGNAYQAYVNQALACVAAAAGEASDIGACAEAAARQCRNTAGVYEPCLDAVAEALDGALLRVAARAHAQQLARDSADCANQFDPACALMARGAALAAAAGDLTGMDAAEWQTLIEGEK